MRRLFFTLIKVSTVTLIFVLLVLFLGPARQPTMSLYHHVLGWQKMDSKNYTDAIREFKISLPGHPFQIEALSNIAFCNYQLGDKQEALNYYWLITEQEPKNYTAHLSIARILIQMGWPKEALKVYEQLLYFYPGDKVLMREAASAYFDAAFKNPQEYHADLVHSYKLFYEGFQNVHPEAPLNPWLQYAETAYRLGYFDTALFIYCPILTQPNTPAESTYLFAKSLEASGLSHDAAVWMQVATNEMADTDPEKAETWFHESQQFVGNLKQALPEKPKTPFQKSCLDTLGIHPKYQTLLESINSGRSHHQETEEPAKGKH